MSVATGSSVGALPPEWTFVVVGGRRTSDTLKPSLGTRGWALGEVWAPCVLDWCA